MAGAGDVNGDGYGDVIVGAYFWVGEATEEGRAYVYYGGATGLSAGGSPDWTADPTDQDAALFGYSVSTAGDANGDGFSDVVVGAYGWDGEATDEGRAFIYHGGAAGLSPGNSPDWTTDPTNQATARFGYSVSVAGDVNADGFGDVVFGARGWDGEAGNEGRAYVYDGWPGSIYVGLGELGNTGWIAVFREAGEEYSFRNWHRLPWSAYNTANGETRPVCGDVDGDGFPETENPEPATVGSRVGGTAGIPDEAGGHTHDPLSGGSLGRPAVSAPPCLRRRRGKLYLGRQ